MTVQGRFFDFGAMALDELANGFRGANLAAEPGLEVTYLAGRAGAGHDFHAHDDLHEVIVILEGECLFTLGQEERRLTGGMAVYAPPRVPHKVRYLADGRALRIKSPARS